MARCAWIMAVLVVLSGCSRPTNPAAPKVPRDAFARVESALAEARQDIFKTPFPRSIGEIMVPDAALLFQQATKGTPLEADATALMEKSQKLAKLCLQLPVKQKPVQDAFSEVETQLNEIKAKL